MLNYDYAKNQLIQHTANVVFIVVDSFCVDFTGTQSFGLSATPFLDTLKEHCIFPDKLYSQGPYTEAGTKGLYCGCDTLDYNGYLCRLNYAPENHMSVFHDKGYETYNMFYPDIMFSKKIQEKIDNKYYTSAFMLYSVWEHRIEYYCGLAKQNKLSEGGQKDFENLLRFLFDAWLSFLDYNQETAYQYVLLEKEILEQIPGIRDSVEKEFERFLSSPLVYTKEIIKDGKNHALFRAQTLQSKTVVSAVFQQILEENQDFFTDVKRKHLTGNLLHFPIRPGKAAAQIKKAIVEKSIDPLRYFSQGRSLLREAPYQYNQLTPSMGKQTLFMLDILKNRKSEAPFFITMHAEDLHYPVSYLSFDLDDPQVINKELEILKEYLAKVNGNFRGLLHHYLSLRYTDYYLQLMFQQLEEMGLLDNTVVAITADHGFSFNKQPLRNNVINNIHGENYHIPLFLYDPQRRRRETPSGFYTSKDVLPTILDCCGLPVPNAFTGKSMLNPHYHNNYAHIEYMGSGCPDMRLRPIQFAIRDDKFLLSYKVCLNEDFSSGIIEDLYDLVKDPLEEKNLVKDISALKEAAYLLEPLKKRHEALKKEAVDCGY